MTVFNPRLDFLRLQLASIQAQSWPNWTCLILDDSSVASSEIINLVRDDKRFTYAHNPNRLGVYHNFERGLFATPSGCQYVTFSDQDDIWDSDKLEISISEIERTGALLVHSDLRLIDESGHHLGDSAWKAERRHIEFLHPISLMSKNSVTGCTVMIDRRLLWDVLPFPPQGTRPTFHHDVWLSILASYRGSISAIPRALISYRQHGENVVGVLNRSANAGWRTQIKDFKNRCFCLTELSDRAYKRITHDQDRSEQLILQEIGPLELAKTLMFFSTTRPPSSFIECIYILKWSIFSLSVATLKKFKNFAQGTGNMYPLLIFKNKVVRKLKKIKSKLGLDSPVEINFAPATQPTMNIIFPSLDPESIFGGVLTAVKLGVELAQSGIKVRFLPLDVPISAKNKVRLREEIEKIFSGKFQNIEIDNFDHSCTRFNSQDSFFATAWWTTEFLNSFRKNPAVANGLYFYLVQDFEPGFYPWSEAYARALASYSYDFIPVFNSKFLREFFQKRDQAYAMKGMAFRPLVDCDRLFPASTDELGPRIRSKKVRVFLYGRPQTPRNLFSIIEKALLHWSTFTKLSAENVEFISAGEMYQPIRLQNGFKITNVGKVSLEVYPQFLRNFDVGISLMLSPHPSYPPLELARSGVICITNDFENKRMAEISDNFEIPADLNPVSISKSLDRAITRSSNLEARISGSLLRFAENDDLASVAKMVKREMEGRT